MELLYQWLSIVAIIQLASSASTPQPNTGYVQRPYFYAHHIAHKQQSPEGTQTQMRASPFRLLAAPYPVYRIVSQMGVQPIKTTTSTTTTTTTTTTTPKPIKSTPRETNIALSPFAVESSSDGFLPEEFPADLISIAREKLGLHRLEEIPSVSELAELLGTRTSIETLATIRKLTETDQGVALMRAYVESSDYTNNGAVNSVLEKDPIEDRPDREDLNHEEEQEQEDEAESDDDDDDDEGPNETPEEVDKELMVVNDDADSVVRNNVEELAIFDNNRPQVTPIIATTTARPLGFFERMYSLLSTYNLWPSQQPVEAISSNLPNPTISMQQPHSLRRLHPIFVRGPLPYHYPIPLRPLPSLTTPVTVPSVTTPAKVPSLATPAKVSSSPIPLHNLPGTLPETTTTKNIMQTNIPVFMTTTTPPPTPLSVIPIQIPTTPVPESVHIILPESSYETSSLPANARLNTPRIVLPAQMQRLLKAANIAPSQLERFLQAKPKLAALAARINAFPLMHDRDAQIEKQLLQAVQRAIEQDDDLRQLLKATTGTLK